MTHIASYPNIMTVGHKLVQTLLDGPVVVQEKVDGSQLSFATEFAPRQEASDPDLIYAMRSKGQDQTGGGADMFRKAWEFVHTLDLHPGWIYRGELLNKPKHNTLAYDRVPKNNIVLYDIETGPSNFLPIWEMGQEAMRLELETVPVFWNGIIHPSELEFLLGQCLATDSFLGGQKIEGVVIKNYNQFTPDGKVMMAKYVSAAFKEVHNKDWKGRNPSLKDFVTELTEKYTTKARWAKAVQHLREQGRLQDAPQDIGPLIGEVVADVKKECEAEIREALFKHFWKDIGRGVTKGLPEWYKDQLLGNFTDPMQNGVPDVELEEAIDWVLTEGRAGLEYLAEVERMENEGG